MKKIWLTSLKADPEKVKGLVGALQPYGIEVQGHFWQDDLDKMTWMEPREMLVDPNTTLWAIMGSAEDLQKPSFRYGLSLLSITLQAQKGHAFPILVLLTEGQVSSEDLPTPLKAADVLPADSATLGAKIVSKLHSSPQETDSGYRLDIYGIPQIGQWFEVGPQSGTWQGAMFGVTGAKITFHAVGPKGTLPDRSVLNYAMKGLELEHGDKEYAAWAVQNEIDSESSYFVKVDEYAETILFGPFSQEDDAEVFVVSLK
jgi:hypothetical protein